MGGIRVGSAQQRIEPVLASWDRIGDAETQLRQTGRAYGNQERRRGFDARGEIVEALLDQIVSWEIV
jgi:hypothetical protein